MAKASSSAEKFMKELECAICLEQYKDPKVLPCLHSFCKTCLEGLLPKEGLAWRVDCPSCKGIVEIPKGEVDLLPANFFLNNLSSMVALHLELERSNFGCDSCDNVDAAINRCATCRQFLCDICTAAHKRGRGTKTHRVMTLEEAREEGPMAVVRPSFCKEHEGEMLKLFCETCDEAVCRDCTIIKHRDHKCTFVKDSFGKEKDIVMKILSETKTKLTILQDALNGVLEMKRSVQSRAEQTAQNVTNCFRDLTASLNTRHDELMNEVEELKKAKLKSLEIQQEELEMAVGVVQNSVGFTEKAFKHGSEVEILNMRKQMSSRLRELNETKWQLKPCADDAVKFEADDQLKQEVATFGLITNVVTHAGASTITMGHGSEGLMYNTLCGQPIEFTIIAKERNGQKRTEGGDPFTACCIDGTDVKNLDVKDCGDGSYTFSYTPMKEGQFKLVVKLMGRDVGEGPFSWSAERWRLLCISGNSEGQIQLTEENLTARLKQGASGFTRGNGIAYCKTGFSFSSSGNSVSTCSSSSVFNGASQGFQFERSHSHGSTSRPFGANSWPYVVSSVCFSTGKHSCKAKLIGKIQEGFSFGIITTSRGSHGTLAKLGNWWLWNSTRMKHLLSSSNIDVQESTINHCASSDIIEMYLDCEAGTLKMYNQRTKESDIWHGVEGDVCPVFHMTTDGDQVSLLL
ncbi:hypothetical protein ACROYT_G027236 [Oculina patagonica]